MKSTHLENGLEAWQAGDFERALDTLHAAVEEDPDNAEAWYWYAATQDRLGMESLASAGYQRALALGCQRRDEAHAFLASSLQKTWRPAEALPHIRAALATADDRALYWAIFGNVMADQGDVVKAEAAYRTAIRLDPDLGLAWHGLGQLLGLMGQSDEAWEAFARARATGFLG